MPALLPDADRLPEPLNYFQGRRRDWSCQTDNVVLFLRKTRATLQRKALESNQHHRFVLVAALESSGVVSVDHREFHLSPGRAVLVFPHQFHYYPGVSSEKIRWLFVSFESETPEAFEPFRLRAIRLTEGALDCLGQILRLALRKSHPLHDNLLASETATLFIHLRSGLGRQQTAKLTGSIPQTGGEGMRILAGVNRSLGLDKGEGHAIRRIAQEYGLSEGRLRFLFRKHFGMSLGAYIRGHVTHQAIGLMKNNRLALYEVADRCGFTSLATFSRSFKKQTGLSPSRFRNRYLRPKNTS